MQLLSRRRHLLRGACRLPPYAAGPFCGSSCGGLAAVGPSLLAFVKTISHEAGIASWLDCRLLRRRRYLRHSVLRPRRPCRIPLVLLAVPSRIVLLSVGSTQGQGVLPAHRGGHDDRTTHGATIVQRIHNRSSFTPVLRPVKHPLLLALLKVLPLKLLSPQNKKSCWRLLIH